MTGNSKGKLENEIDQEIVLEAAKYGLVLERNNSGAFKDTTGRMVFYGLGNVSKTHGQKLKSADRIGILPVLITPDMVGSTIGVFVAVEVKREGWTFNPKDKKEVAQSNWLSWIRQRGGLADFVQSIDDLKKLLGK